MFVGSLVIDRQALSDGTRRMMQTIPIDLDKIGTTLGLETRWYVKMCIRDMAHTEAVVAKSTRTSVLDNLKRPVQPRSTDKKPKQHEAVSYTHLDVYKRQRVYRG